MAESGKAGVGIGSSEELLVGEDDGERLVASVEDQLRKEMTVYEVRLMEKYFFASDVHIIYYAVFLRLHINLYYVLCHLYFAITLLPQQVQFS